MIDKRYVQISLVSGDNSDTHMICWVEYDARLRSGLRLTLKEIDDVEWTVVDVYNQSIMTGHPRRTWRVGGL